MSEKAAAKVIIRNVKESDFPGIIALTRAVYIDSIPWSERQLKSHLDVFPEGQFVAVIQDTDEVVGYAASLIVLWDDYDMTTSWRDFTDSGMFTNHDPVGGKTLYGAEVMVHPARQGLGIGRQIYRAREDLVRRLKLLRIRAGARLRDYHKYADKMTADEYVLKVIRGELQDRTLTFQLKRGFHVLDVVSGYLRHDPESMGFAAVIEWINDEVARPEHYEAYRDSKFNLKSM